MEVRRDPTPVFATLETDRSAPEEETQTEEKNIPDTNNLNPGWDEVSLARMN